MEDRRRALVRLILTGLMAALVFVATRFIQIDLGFSRIKTGNIVCLLSGILLGPVGGGLASGIGSMLYDLTDPRYTAMAYVTFINFFAMGAMAGYVAHRRDGRGLNPKQNLLAAVCGALLYIALYFASNVLTQISKEGATLINAAIAMGPRIAVSLINAAIAVVGATLLAQPLMRALSRAGLLAAIDPPKP